MRKLFFLILFFLFSISVRAEDPKIEIKPVRQFGLGTLFVSAYSPDGKTILTGGGAGAYLWDVSSGLVIRNFHGHTEPVISLAYSPDGTRIVTGSRDGTAKLWDINTGQEIQTFSISPRYDCSVAFSPDGEMLLTGTEKVTVLWSIKENQILKIFKSQNDWINLVEFSPDGKKILTASGYCATLWDIKTGEEIKTFLTDEERISSIAFSPDGMSVLLGYSSKMIGKSSHWNLLKRKKAKSIARLYNIKTGKGIYSFPGDSHFGGTLVAFSPDGKMIVTAFSNPSANLDLWQTSDGTRIKNIPVECFYFGSLDFSPDGKMVLVCNISEEKAMLFDVQSGQKVKEFLGHNDYISSLTFSPDSEKILIDYGNGAFKIYYLETGKEIFNYADGETLHTPVFSPDGKKVLYGMEKSAKVLDLETGKVKKVFSGFEKRISQIRYSPDGKQILTIGYHQVHILDTSTGEEIYSLKGGFSPREGFHGPNCIDLSSDGKMLLVGSEDSRVRLYDIKTGQEIKTFFKHRGGVKSVDFSPDDKMILTGGGDGRVILWDLNTGEEIHIFKEEGYWESEGVFSPNGKMILTTGGGNEAKLWDTETKNEIRTFSASDRDISSVSFSPNGKWVLTGVSDGTALLWDISDLK